MTEDILHETRGNVAWTTLNRPQSRNALTFAMYEGLFEQSKAVAENDAIRAWVITGAGGKAFAAGTDIGQFKEFRTGQDALDYETRIDRVLSAIEDCPKPVIAAVGGFAGFTSFILGVLCLGPPFSSSHLRRASAEGESEGSGGGVVVWKMEENVPPTFRKGRTGDC